MTLGNAPPPSKKFSTVPFLRYGFQLGAPPMPGDKLLSNKQLILGNVNMQNASPPIKKNLPCFFWDTAFDLDRPLCLGIIFCQKTTAFGWLEGAECIPALPSLYDIDKLENNIIPWAGDNQIWPRCWFLLKSPLLVWLSLWWGFWSEWNMSWTIIFFFFLFSRCFYASTVTNRFVNFQLVHFLLALEQVELVDHCRMK